MSNDRECEGTVLRAEWIDLESGVAKAVQLLEAVRLEMWDETTGRESTK
jgi:hypothetical protein